jgi:hypothetical protein
MKLFFARIFETVQRKHFLWFFLMALTSCKPPHLVEDEIPDNISGAFLVLNEGLFQHNNSSITWFHWHTQQNTSELFEKKNFIGMGDTGNDMKIYGENIFVLMNNSHVLHVLNRRSGKLIEQVHLVENGIGASPRNLAFHQGKVYISAFNGYLYKLDTIALVLENKIQLGTNPEQLLLVNDELWVSNSGGLTSAGDSTISVVDLNTFSETNRITIGRNPGSLAYLNGFVYAVARGDYVAIPSKLAKIHAENKTVLLNQEKNLSSVRVFREKLYATGYFFESSSSSLHELNPIDFSETSANLIADLSIQTLYGIERMEVFGQEIFAFLDARQFIHQGKVVITDGAFNHLFSFSVGLNPSKIIFNAP